MAFIPQPPPGPPYIPAPKTPRKQINTAPPKECPGNIKKEHKEAKENALQKAK